MTTLNPGWETQWPMIRGLGSSPSWVIALLHCFLQQNTFSQSTSLHLRIWIIREAWWNAEGHFCNRLAFHVGGSIYVVKLLAASCYGNLWQQITVLSIRFCLYPQELVLLMKESVRIRKLQILSHQFMICKLCFVVQHVSHSSCHKSRKNNLSLDEELNPTHREQAVFKNLNAWTQSKYMCHVQWNACTMYLWIKANFAG